MLDGIIICGISPFLEVGCTATNSGSKAIQAGTEGSGITAASDGERDSVGPQGETVTRSSVA